MQRKRPKQSIFEKFLRIIWAIFNPKLAFDTWKKYGMWASPRGKVFPEETLKARGFTHRCVCPNCKEICYYIRPIFSSRPKDAIYKGDNEKLHPAMTAVRGWPDGSIPSHKSVECFHCNHYIDYKEDSHLVVAQQIGA